MGHKSKNLVRKKCLMMRRSAHYWSISPVPAIRVPKGAAKKSHLPQQKHRRKFLVFFSSVKVSIFISSGALLLTWCHINWVSLYDKNLKF